MGNETDSGIRVESADLHTHARNVGDLSARVGTAAQAAQHLASLDDAYGLLCQQLGLPEMLRQPQETAADSIDHLRDMYDRLGTNLVAGAGEYQRIEEEHYNQLSMIGADLDAAATLPSLGGGAGGSEQDGGAPDGEAMV